MPVIARGNRRDRIGPPGQDEIRWVKDSQYRTIYYCVLVFAAGILAFQQRIVPQGAWYKPLKHITLGIICLVALLGVLNIWSVRTALLSFRRRYGGYYTRGQIVWRAIREWSYAIAFCAIVLGSGFVAFILLLNV